MKTNKFLASLLVATAALAPLNGFSADETAKETETPKETAQETPATEAKPTVDTSGDSIRIDLEKAFIQLTGNSIDALKTAWKNKEDRGFTSKGILDAKFNIVAAETPTQTTTTTTTTASDGSTTTRTSTETTTTESQIGVKIWFELADGTLVNPTKKRWSAREKFYVHIQAAVPVYVALFQNYPDSRPASRQIYPDAKYKDSFKVVQAGQSTRLPVAFEMDGDQRDEIMSMVVVRSDWSGIQNGLTQQATASVQSNNGSLQVTAQVNEVGGGTLKCVNERVVTKAAFTAEDAKKTIENLGDKAAENLAKAINEAAETAKFHIVGSEVETSNQPNDVCFYMFGAGAVGQWQLTIKK